MLKNEMDVLVIAHNICVAFDYVPTKEQDRYIRSLRAIERAVCDIATFEHRKEDQDHAGKS